MIAASEHVLLGAWLAPHDRAGAMAALQARLSAEPRPDALPSALPVASLRRCERLFQPRPLNEGHLSELAQVLRRGGEFDPLAILQVGPDPVVIDGHHRLTAYERAGTAAPVSLRYFDGTVKAAMIEAGLLNHKAKLPMGNVERMNFAWRLTATGSFTGPEITQASGVSLRTLATMRQTARELGKAAPQCSTWREARKAASPGEDRVVDEEWMAGVAADYSKRLHKEFGSNLTGNPELAALALAHHFGARLPDLLGFLAPGPVDDEGEEEVGSQDAEAVVAAPPASRYADGPADF